MGVKLTRIGRSTEALAAGPIPPFNAHSERSCSPLCKPSLYSLVVMTWFIYLNRRFVYVFEPLLDQAASSDGHRNRFVNLAPTIGFPWYFLVLLTAPHELECP